MRKDQSSNQKTNQKTKSKKAKRLQRIMFLQRYKFRLAPRLESGVRKKLCETKIKKFLSLLKGFNNVDMHNLWHKDKVLPFYMPESLSIESKKTPWPVVLLVHKYNKKHVQLDKSPLAPDFNEDEFKQFDNRMRWKWQFAQRNDDDTRADFFIKGTRRCTMDEAKGKPAMLMWIKEIQQVINRHVKNELPRIKEMPVTIKYESVARQWLQQNSMALIPEDKRPGFCMMPIEKIKIAHEAILVQPNYEEIAPPNTSVLNTIEKTYMSLCQKLGKVTENMKNTSMASKSWELNTQVFAKLGITVKTHKKQGNVKCRDIQAMASDKFQGLSVWLGKYFRKKVATLPFILKDATELAKLLRERHMPPDCILKTADIESFFMSGTAEQIHKDVNEFLLQEGETRDMRELVNEVTTNLIDWQYVTSDQLKGRTWKVKRGTGMGRSHSGELADILFFHKAERNLRERMKTYQIQFYSRFKDDILVIAQDNKLANEFLNKMNEDAGYFELTYDEEPSTKEEYLSMEVSLDDPKELPGMKVITKGLIKATKLRRPLSTASMHPDHVHRMWPRASLIRLMGLSTNRKGAKEAKKTYIEKIQNTGHNAKIIRMLKEVKPSIHPPLKKEAKRLHNVIWLPLVYHKELEGAYKNALKEINNSDLLEALWEEAFRYKIPKPEIRRATKMKTLTIAAKFQLSQRLQGQEGEQEDSG